MSCDLILITGVSGYIGFKTMILALEAGFRVRAVVRKIEQILKLQNHTRVQQHVDRLEFVVVLDLANINAFDSVLDGVSGILHLASPLAIETEDYEKDIVQPALDVTLSVLEAAERNPSVKRVVMTSSAVTLTPFQWLSAPEDDKIFTEQDLNSAPTRPFHSSMEAYWVSKALSRMATKTFIKDNNPAFDIINLLPTVVIGRDELATNRASLLTGTRALAMSMVLGQKTENPLVGQAVHVDDVARAHVDALKSSVPGNRDYILTSDSPEGIEWNDVKPIVDKHFPEAVAKGILSMEGEMPTRKWRIDVEATEMAFGWKCQSFEETMRSLVGQYLELVERNTD